MALTKIPANMVSIVGGNEVTESGSDATVSILVPCISL